MERSAELAGGLRQQSTAQHALRAHALPGRADERITGQHACACKLTGVKVVLLTQT